MNTSINDQNKQRLKKVKSLNGNSSVNLNQKPSSSLSITTIIVQHKKKWRPPGFYEIPNILGKDCYLYPTDPIYEYHLRKYDPSKNISRKPWLPGGICTDIPKLSPLLNRSYSSTSSSTSSSSSSSPHLVNTFENQLISTLPKNINISNLNPLNKYNDFQEIGKGVNGLVLKVSHKIKKYSLAIKRCIIENDQEYKITILNELKIMSMGHHNLIRLREVTLWKKEIWIGMDLQLCSVFTLLCHCGIPEQYTIYIFQETLKGLIFLHSKGYIHRDIKSENLLIGFHGEIKLTDFGLSTTSFISSSNNHHQRRRRRNNDRLGTCQWMAPEVIREQYYDEKIDIWSLGITLIELMDRVPPHFLLKNELELFTTILNHPNPNFTYSHPSSYLRSFTSWLLDTNPTTRPNAEEVADELLNHIQNNLLKRSNSLEFTRFVSHTIFDA